MQLSFKFDKVRISAGDNLLCAHTGQNLVFLNELGLEITGIPEGAEIAIEGFGIGVGINMPPDRGTYCRVNGEACYRAKNFAGLGFETENWLNTRRLLQNDHIKILSLPDC